MTLRQTILGEKGGRAAIGILAVLLIYLFIFRGIRFFTVPSASMEPALRSGDYIVTLKERTYAHGDIVVLRDPEESGAYIVKRIAGMGGDTIAVWAGAVYVNGAYVSEPYVNEPPDYFLAPVTVPEGKVFLLGDNRNNSDDSHLWKDPSQPIRAIIGKVRFIYYPYGRAGTVRGFNAPRSQAP